MDLGQVHIPYINNNLGRVCPASTFFTVHTVKLRFSQESLSLPNLYSNSVVLKCGHWIRSIGMTWGIVRDTTLKI